MLEEGARVLERAATASRPAAGRRALLDAAKALRDARARCEARLAAGRCRPRSCAALAATRCATSSPRPSGCRCGSTASARCTAAGTSSSRAPRAPRTDPRPACSRSGTFRTATERLPAVAAMGFDVVYLPPVHPIGTTYRKGPNNTLDPGPDDAGSPWAIGSAEGGHDAIHPDLGTFEDFDAFVAARRELGHGGRARLALQASPDHPWVKEHPEWFTDRADGTIAYAENPPKKYQDIYPINFDNDPDGIYAEVPAGRALLDDHGVRIFRVDNPHTKPVSFWEWLLGEVRKTDPDVLFLAEAFTRPAMMQTLAKVGFHQSYTYFTWRNEKWELEEYLTELSTQTAALPAAQLLRQHPGHPARVPAVRRPAGVQDPGRAGRDAVAVLGRLRGLRAVRARRRAAGQRGVPGLREVPAPPARLGRRPRPRAARSRRTSRGSTRSAARHPALQRLRNLTLPPRPTATRSSASPSATARGRATPSSCVVNLDPHGARETTVHLDMPALGLRLGRHASTCTTRSPASTLPVVGSTTTCASTRSREPAHVFTRAQKMGGQ